MNKYVKIKFNGKISPYLLFADEHYQWTEEQIKSENGKAVELAKMAFLDHGQPLIPLDSLDDVLATKAAYLTPAPGITFLIYEGGNFMTLLPQMEVVEEKMSRFYPIEEGYAIVCENDPFDKNRGGMDHWFTAMYQTHTDAKGFHTMYSFRNRMEEEIIEAFRNAPAIMFHSSYTSADWWGLMIRCILKSGTKAKVIGNKPYYPPASERFEKCVEMAKQFDIKISF